MSVYEHRRAVRALSAIFAVAVVVSIVHYTDNYVNFNDYPQPTTGPKPSATGVLVAWFAFTAAGLAGYLLFRRRASGGRSFFGMRRAEGTGARIRRERSSTHCGRPGLHVDRRHGRNRT